MPDETNNLLVKDLVFEEKANALLAEVDASQLTGKAKHDAHKVLECLLFLNNNLALFKKQVENSEDPSMYQKGISNKGVPYDNYQTRTMRDHRLTGYHVDYPSSTDALKELHYIFDIVTAILSRLNPEKRLEFANKFYFDPRTSCLVGRIQNALKWVEDNDQPSLNEIMEISRAKHGEKTIVEFAEEYCQKNNFTKCFHEGMMDIPITHALLEKYAENILGEQITDPQLQQEYLAFCDKNNFISVGQDEIYHYFPTHEMAVAFADWINQQAKLRKGTPAQAHHFVMEMYDYISLSRRQFDIIMGKEAFKRLLSDGQINSAYAEIANDILNLAVWRRFLQQPSYLEPFNQRRLLLLDNGFFSTHQNLLQQALAKNISSADFRNILLLLNADDLDLRSKAIAGKSNGQRDKTDLLKIAESLEEQSPSSSFLKSSSKPQVNPLLETKKIIDSLVAEAEEAGKIEVWIKNAATARLLIKNTKFDVGAEQNENKPIPKI